ncbi:hypothetical protein SK128_027326, partial [Halocaridina rubra]
FGSNKKLSLEYEFEQVNIKVKNDQEDFDCISKESSQKSPESSHIRTNVSSIKHIVSGLHTPTSSSVCISLLDQSDALVVKNKELSVPEVVNSMPSSESEEKVEEEEKHAAVENLSGMLTQLLTMARVILAKPPTDTCSCGHVCGRGGGGLRSPASSRGQGLFGLGRSPGNTRSPRNCRVTAVGTLSPGACSPIAQSRSPLAAKQLKERTKPASAKRLIPDQLDGRASQVSLLCL